MTKYTRSIGASLFIAGALLAGCNSEPKKGPDSAALGADTTLNRDLAMANRDTAAQPQLKDVPANAPAATPTPAPTTTRPRTTPRSTPRTTAPARNNPPAPTTTTTTSGNTRTTNPGAASNPSSTGGGAVGSIAAGSTLSTHASSRICTNTNQVGDHVTATLENAVSGSNGASIPAGASVNLTVTRLKRSENANDPVVMAERSDERTLERIVRIGTRAEHADREPGARVAVAMHQRRERLGVAVEDGVHDFMVRPQVHTR